MSAPIRALDIPTLLEDLERRQFFGSIKIEFNRGEPRMVRIEETRLVESEGESRERRTNH